MKTMQNKCFRVSASVLAVAIATTGISLPTFVRAQANQPTKLAQALIGQCRAVNKKVSVYKQASTTGAAVSTLNAETKVTLADNGSGGFIGISSPVSGYIQVANLKLCSGTPTPTPSPTPAPTPTPTPTPTGNTCRRVVQPLGLSIRREASPTSAYVGGVGFQENLYLTTTPATSKLGADGRNWVQVARPAAGWVSNGFQNSSGNLVLCP